MLKDQLTCCTVFQKWTLRMYVCVRAVCVTVCL